MQDPNEHPEKENIHERVEDVKKTVTEKAEEFAHDAKGKAEDFASKTIDAAEKLINDVFGKNKENAAAQSEAATDTKDIEIAELKKELEELRDKYVRLYADFDNARKRMAREKLEIIQTASKDLIRDLLPVLDDFERAQKAMAGSDDVNAVREGVQLVHNKLHHVLTSKGLKAMESIGQEFNSDQHEAITEIPAPTPEQAGKVIDEVEKGYYLSDKIIRFAKVIVGK